MNNKNLIILGTIDYLMDAVGENSNRLEIRNDLLSAIMARFNARIMANPDFLAKIQEIAPNLSDKPDDFTTNTQTVMENLSDLKLNEADASSFLLNETKSVLLEFLDMTQPDDKESLIKFVNNALS